MFGQASYILSLDICKDLSACRAERMSIMLQIVVLRESNTYFFFYFVLTLRETNLYKPLTQ